MSRATSTVLAMLLVVATAAPVVAEDPASPTAAKEQPAAPALGAIIPGQVVVQLRPGAGDESIRSRGLRLLPERVAEGDGLPFIVSTDGRPVADVLAELRTDPAVAAAEPNYRVELAGGAAVAVNDPLTADQYSLDQMRVRDAWSITTGGGGVLAVLDTGAQLDHPDLVGRLVAGHDFVNDDDDPSDDNGHGTWVAGVIAANANDGYGTAGVSWTDKVMPVKIMDGTGSGSTADLMNGIRWAADHGATIINMSVGGFPYSQLVQDAVNYAWDKGVVLVGAAGNNRRSEEYYPASFDNIVSVSATQAEDEFANWSSWGPKVDVSAPGASVRTTNCYECTYADHNTWGEHTYISGTSFATPNVAGVVALIRAKFPTWTPSQIVGRLLNTSDDLGYPGWDDRYGRGRVNAYRAVGATVSGPGPSTGDQFEVNNSLSDAVKISLGTVVRPTIHPAGDVDWFAVDIGRAGRLDVRVTGVTDSRAYPWNRSPIPIDPIVELYSTSGTLLKHVDLEWEGGTELAQWTVSGPQRILVRVVNWYANGNTAPYSITATYVDTVAPVATITSPPSGSSGVSRIVQPTVTFNEAVSNVTAATVQIRDLVTDAVVPATVEYDPAAREARIVPERRLEAARAYQVEATAGVVDVAGNPLALTTLPFTSGSVSFYDTDGIAFEQSIEWLVAQGITTGCAPEYFCPDEPVTRAQMASFLVRALDLPPTPTDSFSDDDGSLHEIDINRLAAAGITGGCSATRFCPDQPVTRAQMASFLARALALPGSFTDAFSDDDGTPHEFDINRVAAAGITTGCEPGTFCPGAAVSRGQMAAFLQRALGD